MEFEQKVERYVATRLALRQKETHLTEAEKRKRQDEAYRYLVITEVIPPLFLYFLLGAIEMFGGYVVFLALLWLSTKFGSH